MFTSQSSLLLSALGNATDPDTARQITQVFANCNQDLSHNGSISVNSAPAAQKNGVLNSSPWGVGAWYGGNYYGTDTVPYQAQSALRPGGGAAYANLDLNPFEMPNPGGGYRSGDWITYQGDNNTFDVAPRITETTNQFYGGPTFQVAGDTVFNNTTTNNSYVTNQITQNLMASTINDIPINPDKGDPLIAEPQGAPANPGDPGAAGPAGPAGAVGANGLNGQNGVPGGLFFVPFGGQGFPLRPFVPPVGVGPGPAIQNRLVINNAFTLIQNIQNNYTILVNQLANMNLQATLNDDCTITITGNWPDALGGVTEPPYTGQ